MLRECNWTTKGITAHWLLCAEECCIMGDIPLFLPACATQWSVEQCAAAYWHCWLLQWISIFFFIFYNFYSSYKHDLYT